MSEDRCNAGTLVDRNLEAGRGDKTAIRCAGAELTYAQLHDRICRAGNALRALGVRREDRVLMILDDTPAFPAVFLGAIRIGAVAADVSDSAAAKKIPPWTPPLPPCRCGPALTRARARSGSAARISRP